jgi:hypothetical protein
MNETSKEMQWLYEEIYIYGTPYKKLIEDGFTLDEINYVRTVLNNDKPIKL